MATVHADRIEMTREELSKLERECQISGLLTYRRVEPPEQTQVEGLWIWCGLRIDVVEAERKFCAEPIDIEYDFFRAQRSPGASAVRDNALLRSAALVREWPTPLANPFEPYKFEGVKDNLISQTVRDRRRDVANAILALRD